MTTPRTERFRPSAVPLVTHDPYLSCWSTADHLYDDWPRHWTDAPHSMAGTIRVDGTPYRFLGGPVGDEATAHQIDLEVTPTRSIYAFTCGKVFLTVTFTSPLLLDDLDLLSRPASYITFEVTSIDGPAHEISIAFDIAGEWAVDRPWQDVTWRRVDHPMLKVASIGSVAQPVLRKRGDDVRIDWGTLYLAAPPHAEVAIGRAPACRELFQATGQLPPADWDVRSYPANLWGGPVLMTRFALSDAGPEPRAATVIVAYDDEYAIEYFHRPLRAWWRRNAPEGEAAALAMLTAAVGEHESIVARCRAFDGELTGWAERVGGADYARLLALVYRQAIAAHKLVAGPDGQPLFLSKENNSNGCIGTVDVTYPSSPLFLIFNPDLVKAMVVPIIEYCRTDDWIFPFAAHDLGTYPQANGQAYGRNRLEGQMPVEESGNVLILCAAVATLEGNADFIAPYWDTLTAWADYLREQGFDPGDQLCTDDFAGRLAHNANLSIKAILGLASYARLARMLGHKKVAREVLAQAHEYAAAWEEKADDGDHTRLTFDRPGTWSLKYNLIWDQVLGFELFSPEVARKEVAHYLRMQNRYGVPLDNRRDYTKSDWVLWCAALADSDADFRALVAPIVRYVSETPDRVPVSDWHDTHTAERQNFKARSVVGGYFMKLLQDKLS